MSDDREPAARDKMVIFHGAGAPSLAESGMSVGRSHVAGEPIDDFFSEAIMESFTSAVPFRQEGPEGFSLVSLDFPPGAMLPRHSHSADCLYYIVSGGIVMGTRELGPGDGFGSLARGEGWAERRRAADRRGRQRQRAADREDGGHRPSLGLVLVRTHDRTLTFRIARGLGLAEWLDLPLQGRARVGGATFPFPAERAERTGPEDPRDP